MAFRMTSKSLESNRNRNRRTKFQQEEKEAAHDQTPTNKQEIQEYPRSKCTTWKKLNQSVAKAQDQSKEELVTCLTKSGNP